MSDELVFYTHPMSRGRIVRWMLEEVGHPYRTVILDYGTTMKDAAYRAINPMGKVPALSHGDAVVTECAAICAYLADAFPETGLAPPVDSALRGPYYRWLFFGAGPLEAAASNSALGIEVPPERQRMVGYGTLSMVLDAIEGGLGGGVHLVGERFSAADLYVSAQLGWLMQFGVVEKRPAFLRFTEAHSARPAAVTARRIDDALVPSPPVAG